MGSFLGWLAGLVVPVQDIFCSALAALVGPVQKIFVPIIAQQAGQAAVLGRLFLSMSLRV